MERRVREKKRETERQKGGYEYKRESKIVKENGREFSWS